MAVKQYYTQLDGSISLLSEYFEFNDINYSMIDLSRIVDNVRRLDIPEKLLNSTENVLVVDGRTFSQLIGWPKSFDHLVEFLNSGNTLIFSSDMDSMVVFNYCYIRNLILLLDSKLNSVSITYLLDGKLPDKHWSNLLVNARIVSRPYSHFAKIGRLHFSGTEKYNNAYPYLITTILKDNSPYRFKLYKQLSKKKELFDQGLCVFNTVKDRSKFVGQFNSASQVWRDGYPSMDLYKNAWLELVPETLYKGGYFFTEKTAKPIATKTPFLIISSMGYLEYLKSLGFKTFGHLISEKYDLEHRVDDRIRLAIEQLEDIVNNDAKDFYKASLDIIEHNQNRLAEITGRWHIDTDQCISEVLSQVDQ